MPIEVQDCSYYALVIDVWSSEEYEDDHIPGTVQSSPAVVTRAFWLQDWLATGGITGIADHGS